MEKNVRKVILSDILDKDLAGIYDYGLETFGESLADLFIGTIYQRIYELPLICLLHPECRQLPTKTQSYRNIILGRYLIIYRVKASRIEVLRLFTAVRILKRSKQSKK